MSIVSKARSRSRAGLTLVEILFVMAVFAILVALVIGLGRYADSAARINQARADLGEWTVALGRWHDAFGEYPRPPEGEQTVHWLATNTISIARFEAATGEIPLYTSSGNFTNTFSHAAFFRDLPTNDPWRQPYRYEAKEAVGESADPSDPLLDYKLYSIGPDGKDGKDGKDTTANDNITFSN